VTFINFFKKCFPILTLNNNLALFIVFSVSSYRRKHIESYSSHDLFRKENSEAAEIRQLSAQEAQDDATKWLQDGGDVAVSIELEI
jgi:hypothetical protein